MFRAIYKKCLGKRRMFLSFLIVITLSIWYICYQAMSVHKLGEELSAQHIKRKDDQLFLRQYQKADFPVHLYPLDGNSVNQEAEIVVNRDVTDKSHGIRIRGLLSKHIKNYIPNSRGNFVCLHSSHEVPYNRVNNDYCDCDDGSDEPSTSACQNGRFYCEHQLSPLDEVFIVSSRVNDGICDCCDGSDEWSNVQVPPHAKLNDFYEEKLKVDQTPCRNRCK
ncbi:hypothetical protein CHUAL_008655 [Chamberlinius hualienensis]